MFTFHRRPSRYTLEQRRQRYYKQQILVQLKMHEEYVALQDSLREQYEDQTCLLTTVSLLWQNLVR